MDLAGILDGDELLIDRGADPKPGHIVMAFTPQSGHTVKRLIAFGGFLLLSPESTNLSHQDISLQAQECTIIGVVTALIRRFGTDAPRLPCPLRKVRRS